MVYFVPTWSLFAGLVTNNHVISFRQTILHMQCHLKQNLLQQAVCSENTMFTRIFDQVISREVLYCSCEEIITHGPFGSGTAAKQKSLL